MERIGVLGGTFDPIHIGHLIMGIDLRDALRLDRVLVVPAGQPPHKPGQVISPASDRVAMIDIAIDGLAGFERSDIDLDRSGPSYTVETLRLLQLQYPDAQLVFLMGGDSLRDLPTWHRPNDIARQAEIGVAARPGVEMPLERVLEQVPEAQGRVTIVPIPLIGVSGTDIRARVREGRSIRFQVHDGVERYIRENRLYLPAG